MSNQFAYDPYYWQTIFAAHVAIVAVVIFALWAINRWLP